MEKYEINPPWAGDYTPLVVVGEGKVDIYIKKDSLEIRVLSLRAHQEEIIVDDWWGWGD